MFETLQVVLKKHRSQVSHLMLIPSREGLKHTGGVGCSNRLVLADHQQLRVVVVNVWTIVYLFLLILWSSLPSCHHKNQALTWAGVYSWGIARAQAARRARQMVERNILSQVLSILLKESTATGLPQLLAGFYRMKQLC